MSKKHEAQQPKGPAAYRAKAERTHAAIVEMEAVNAMIAQVMRGRDSHDDKVGQIAQNLADRGYTDSQIADIMEPKPGLDGRSFMGFPFAEINAKRGYLKTLEVLEKKAPTHGFTAREQGRSGQEHTEGRGPS